MDYIGITQQYIADMYPRIMYAKPSLQELPPGAILGTWAYSIPGKVRFILSKELEIAPGVLPGDLTRAWIREEYQLPIRRKKIQIEPHYKVPLHAFTGKFGDCSYVDIKGAYLKILSLGYDLEYRHGKYIGCVPRPVPEQIAKNKFSYAIAVAMSCSPLSKLSVMGKEGVFTHRPFNLYSNPCLFSLAQETLNAIGSEVLNVMGGKVVYMNTDGFIVRSEYAHCVSDIISSWGFDSRIKAQGETEIFGVGSFKCGEYKTLRRDDYAQDFTGKLMDRHDRHWLKRHWQKWNGKLNG